MSGRDIRITSRQGASIVRITSGQVHSDTMAAYGFAVSMETDGDIESFDIYVYASAVECDTRLREFVAMFGGDPSAVPS